MADILADLQKQGISKRVLYGGKGAIPRFTDGSKATFHYCTKKCDEDKTILDDSRHHKKPMELLFGKKFKLEVWETLLKSMKVKEVAEFTVESRHVDCYPIVAKSLRDINKPHDHDHAKEQSHHCCGMMAMSQKGMGYPDLDDLIEHPQPLTFTIELLKLEGVDDYEKESWIMNEDEKLTAVPGLHEEGNQLYKEKCYEDAAIKYGKALGMLEDLVLREKPGDEPWIKLEDMKRPLLLNFSQCKLMLKDYYPVIEHTSTVLDRDPDNVKALYRRAKAHVGAWNPVEAREDFQRVAELDPSLIGAVKKELKQLTEMQKQKDTEDRAKLQGKMF